MIQLTNTETLTLEPGESVTYNVEQIKTGCAECHRRGSGIVTLNRACAIYDVSFSANIGATAQGLAELSIALDGESLPETAMLSQTAAAGDLNNVSKGTFVKTCCRGGDTVTVKNTGATTVTVEDPTLRVGRWN